MPPTRRSWPRGRIGSVPTAKSPRVRKEARLDRDEDESGVDEELPEDESGPNRRCIVEHAVGPASAMLRFVVGPGDCVVPDIEGRLPGRGMWLSARADVVNTAVARNLFSKAARRRVSVPADLTVTVERLLVSRLVATIALARRAGQAVMGYDKVESALRAGRGALILAASDGAVGGRGKIEAAGRGKPIVTVLNSTELGMPFGRDYAIHALLDKGRLAERVLQDSGRLAGFRNL